MNAPTLWPTSEFIYGGDPDRHEVGENRWYTYPPTGKLFVSVTTVLGDTKSKPWLAPWSAKLAAEHAVDNMDRFYELLQSGTAPATLIDEIKREAARQKEIKADAGKHLHAVAEALILWAKSPAGRGSDVSLPDLPEHLVGAEYDDEPIEDVIDAMVRGFMQFVTDFDPTFLAAEMTGFNPELGTAGTLDLIVQIRGYGRVLIDIKSGKYLSATMPAQLAAYKRFPVVLLPNTVLVEMPRVDLTAVLHVRKSYAKGYKLLKFKPADDAAAWNTFRRALHLFNDYEAVGNRIGEVAYPFTADGNPPLPMFEDIAGMGRFVKPLAVYDLHTVADLAGLSDRDLLKVEGIGPKAVERLAALRAEYLPADLQAVA